MTSASVLEESLCVGRVAEFITTNLPADRVERDRKALSLCQGCPGMIACAQDALDNKLTGMVAAGEPIPDGGAGVKAARTRLRRVIDGLPRGSRRVRAASQPKPKVGRPVKPRAKSARLGEPCCSRCKRATRPRTAETSLYPDTVATHARGLCRECYLHCYQKGTLKNYSDRRTLAESNTPSACAECKRPVRGRGELVKDHPGTVPYAALGMCMACYRRVSKDSVAS